MTDFDSQSEEQRDWRSLSPSFFSARPNVPVIIALILVMLIALTALFFYMGRLGLWNNQAKINAYAPEASQADRKIELAVIGDEPLAVLVEKGSEIQEELKKLNGVNVVRLRSGIVRTSRVNVSGTENKDRILAELISRQLASAQDRVVLGNTVILTTNQTSEELLKNLLESSVSVDGKSEPVSKLTTITEAVDYGKQIHWMGYRKSGAQEFTNQKAIIYEIELDNNAELDSLLMQIESVMANAQPTGSKVEYKIVAKPHEVSWYQPLLSLFSITEKSDTRTVTVFVPVPDGLDESALIERSAQVDEVLKRYTNAIDYYYYRHDGLVKGNAEPFLITVALVPESQRLQKIDDISSGLQAELIELFGDEADVYINP